MQALLSQVTLALLVLQLTYRVALPVIWPPLNP